MDALMSLLGDLGHWRVVPGVTQKWQEHTGGHTPNPKIPEAWQLGGGGAWFANLGL